MGSHGVVQHQPYPHSKGGKGSSTGLGWKVILFQPGGVPAALKATAGWEIDATPEVKSDEVPQAPEVETWRGPDPRRVEEDPPEKTEETCPERPKDPTRLTWLKGRRPQLWGRRQRVDQHKTGP